MNRVVREICDLLRDILAQPSAKQFHDRSEKLLPLLAWKPTPKVLPGPSLKEKRLARKAAQRKEIEELRAAVLDRAGGKCEACKLPSAVLQVDHFLGGSGRRRELQSIENCWALDGNCHRQRTENYPTAAHWNQTFALHVAICGYPPPVLHVEHARLTP